MVPYLTLGTRQSFAPNGLTSCLATSLEHVKIMPGTQEPAVVKQPVLSSKAGQGL